MSPDFLVAITACVLHPSRERLSLELSHGVNFNKAMTIGGHVRHHIIIKQRSHFLKRKARCLWKEFTYETERYDIAPDEDHIVPLTDISECSGAGSRVKDCGHEVSEKGNG